ncbi:MAG: fibronectin type III domain-containing protein [Verrucomicrobia bacterium]|nr:fibronectin type III domain-containing protein [Verrucomicrobiota bacterium]
MKNLLSRLFLTPLGPILAAAVVLPNLHGAAAGVATRAAAVDPVPALVEFSDVAPARSRVALAKEDKSKDKGKEKEKETGKDKEKEAKPPKFKVNPELKRAPRIQLALPNGLTVTAVRSELNDLGNGDFVWVGEVENHPFSQVALTSYQGASAGMVHLPWVEGGEYFDLLPQGDGGYVLVPVSLDGVTDGEPIPGGDGPAENDLVPATELNPAVVDLMLLYTPDARAHYEWLDSLYGTSGGIQARLVTAVATANAAMRNSRIHLLFNLVHMAEIYDPISPNMSGSLSALMNQYDGVMDEAHVWRDQYKADVVSLIGLHDGAGIGYVMSYPSIGFAGAAFSVVNANFLTSYTLHHEIGHNLGCAHNRASASVLGCFPYSFGYLDCVNGFGTVMAYSCTSGGYAQRINYFSNPDVLYNGFPTGVWFEDPNSADNARTINLTGPVAQQWRTGTVAPAAPSNLGATATVNGTTVFVTWTDNSANEAGFRLERSTDQVNWSVIATLAANIVSFEDAGLTPESTYHYRLRSYNGGGFSAYSDTASVVTTTNPPAAPTGLTATAINESQINLAWADNSTTETGFTIERSAGGGPWTQIAQVPANSTSFADTGLTMGTTYSYRVRSYNGVGSSAWSNTASATPQPPPPPATPSGLNPSAVSSSQISLVWSDNANNETSHQLERSLNGVVWSALATLGANVTSYLDTGLDPATTYHYRLRACNSGGCSDFTPGASATTLPLPPAAPSGLTATALSQTEIGLAWADNSANETGFQVERSLNGTSWSPAFQVAANVTSSIDTGRTANTLYYYRVIAFNAGGSSVPSGTASATTLPNPPAAPANLTATAVSPTQINLAWQDLANNETGFQVERSIAGGAWTLAATLGANVTVFQDTGLTPETAHSYRVRAVNAGGASAWSNVGSASTPAIPTLNPPLNPAATAVSWGMVDLVWTDNNTIEDGFEVQRSVGGQAWTPVAWVGPNLTSYRDSGLSAQTAYSYRVLAFSGASYSAASTTVTVATPAFVAPTATVTFNSIGSEDGYTLESAETSNIGGSFKAGTAYVGDSSRKYQYKSIFSFDTGPLPDSAVVVAAQLRLNVSATTGVSPWTTHGNCLVDIKGGSGFGGSTALAKTDFEAPADATQVATLSAAAKGQWSEGALNEAGRGFVNRTGKTQLRVYFALDDDNDGTADYVTFLSGSASTASLRPQLVVTYEASPTPAAAPFGLVAKPVSVTQIGLTWFDPANNETGFKIERSVDGVNWVEIARTTADVVMYTDSGLIEGQSYSYRVRSYNDLGVSSASNTATAVPSNPPVTGTFNSISTEDGWILESGENTGVGGSIKAGAAFVGDDRNKKQYLSIFSFDTSALPDNAVIVSARLRLRVAAFAGTSPWQTHGNCLVDVKGGTGFGGATALAVGDFAAAADVVAATTLSVATAVGQWSEGTLSSAGLNSLNKVGKTQFRIYFQLDDDNDGTADYVSFSAGGAAVGSKPELIVEYLLP